jgi:hypothetical protein
MSKVTLSDVRDIIGVTSNEVPDDKLHKMVTRATVTLSLELDKIVDSDNCSEAEKEFITLLAAVYVICYLTGGSAVGLNFSVGDQNIAVTNNIPPLTVLQHELERILSKLKKPTLRSV